MLTSPPSVDAECGCGPGSNSAGKQRVGPSGPDPNGQRCGTPRTWPPSPHVCRRLGHRRVLTWSHLQAAAAGTVPASTPTFSMYCFCFLVALAWQALR